MDWQPMPRFELQPRSIDAKTTAGALGHDSVDRPVIIDVKDCPPRNHLAVIDVTMVLQIQIGEDPLRRGFENEWWAHY